MRRFTILAITIIAAATCSLAWSQVDSSLFVNLATTKACVKVKESKLITFDGSEATLFPFFRKLNGVLSNERGEVNIWHVGGSHVQAGVFSHQVRRNFARLVNGGKASRTIMFPYKLIGTNGPDGYRVSGTGTWTKAKCTDLDPKYDLGLSGITAVTTSPQASVTFTLSNDSTVDWSVRKIKVLGNGSKGVLPYIVAENSSVKCNRQSIDGVFEFDLPVECTSFTVMFHGLGDGKSFELRGVIASNELPGVNYWASGVNGAATSSWLKCSLLEHELKQVAPDMVIFGIGINDAHTTKFKPEKFKVNYQLIIDKIKRVNPNCHFLFVTNNDNKLKKGVNPNTQLVEQAFMELARENKGSVWNLYRVMGGYGSSRKWVASSLMKKDHIHFTREGYKVIGDLLYNAIIQEYFYWKH